MALLIALAVLIQAMTNDGLGADNYTLSTSDITNMLRVREVYGRKITHNQANSI